MVLLLPPLLAGTIVLLVLAFIVYVVATQNKSIGALIQLGGLQRRADENEVIQEEKAAIDKVAAPRRSLALSERLSFTIGMMNIGATAFVLGHWPGQFYLLFTPKALVLISARWWDFRHRSQPQHYLLLDFCYFAALLLLVYCWILPDSEYIFQIIFVLANGPLAWAILAFNQALVLHKWQQTTSVLLHVSPALTTLGVRWYASTRFSVCADWPACLTVGPGEMLWAAISRFYIWWLLFYYVFVFVVMGDYMKTRSYQTLYDRVAGKQMRFLFAHRRVDSLPILLKQGIYMLIHLSFASACMAFATLLFHSWISHFAFLATLLTMSAWNASSFYRAQFVADRQKSN